MLKSLPPLHKAYPIYANFACPGLGNPGNLCYFNSLIQTFASSTQWRHFFRKNKEFNPVLEEFSSLLEKLCEPFANQTSLSTKYLRQLLHKIGIKSSVSVQQDFHDFYIRLLEALEKLFNQSVTIPLSAFSTKRIFPSHLFFEESIECSLCHHVISSINQESFIILDVSHGSMPLALQQYFGPLPLTSSCPKCSRTSNRILTRKILFPPKSVLFFISRNQFNSAPSLKPFPYSSQLDMSQYCIAQGEIQKKENPMMKISLSGISEAIQDKRNGYELTSVVTFRGKDNYGHYIAYRLHTEPNPPFAKRWVCTNDNMATACTLERVINSNQTAVLLNYEIVRDD